MNHDYEQTEFSKSLFAGLFAGITATVLSEVYNAYFRLSTGFPLSEIVNVPTLIFSLVILATIAGMIFYVFHHYIKNGTALYQVAAALVTVLLVIAAMQVRRSPDLVLAKEFRELLLGVIIITGISIVFIVPFLFKRDYV